MKNNVINFKKVETPEDLMSFREFADAYNMRVGYLYKLYTNGKISRYKRGVWKISQKEVLNALERAE